MKISDRIENDIVIISLGGELKEDNMHEVRQHVCSFLENNVLKGAIINFQEITWMDSSGIGMIISLFIEFKAKQIRLILCQLNSDLTQYFKLMNLDRVLSLYPDETKALDSF